MTRRAHLLATGGALAAVYAACAATALVAVPRHPALAPAIAGDLILTATALVWWLAVRPGHARPRALVAVAFAGIAATRWLVGLGALGALGVAIDLAVVAWIGVRLRRVVRGVRAGRRAGLAPTAALDDALAAVVPRAVASAVAVEVSALVLALTGWARRRPAGFAQRHRGGYLALIVGGAVLAVAEGVAAHLLIARASPAAAWIVTGLSIYGLVWLVGDAQAVRLSPVRATDAGLVLARGVRWHVVVPWPAIASAAPVDGRVDGALDLAVLGPNVVLTLTGPVLVRGPFGITRRAARLTVGVDDRDGLLALIAARTGAAAEPPRGCPYLPCASSEAHGIAGKAR